MLNPEKPPPNKHYVACDTLKSTPSCTKKKNRRFVGMVRSGGCGGRDIGGRMEGWRLFGA